MDGVDNEQVFGFTDDERLFAAHMFAKHSFGVKYLLRIARDLASPLPPSGAVSHPRSTLETMTAALVFTPSIPTPSTTVSSASAVCPEPSVAGRRAPTTPEIYRRRRLVVGAVAVGLVLGLASFGRQADAAPTPEVRTAEAVSVVVEPGDTLWGIARDLAPGADPRPLVAALSDLAGDGPLQPGQLLRVPREMVG